MAKLIWTDQFNIGIDVIDQQHRRIAEYINQLDEAHSRALSQKVITDLINALVDYTISHFGFEESLQEEAGYPFFTAHKKVHDLFAKRVSEFQARLANNENITEELSSLLVIWLTSHIKGDDADYAESVRTYLKKQHAAATKKKGLFSRMFS